MVFAILVETTFPIRVLRSPGALLVLIFSAIAYFFSVAAFGFLVAAFFAVAGFFAFVGTRATGAAALGAIAFGALTPLPPASCFSRWMVWMRAMSFFSPRIFFRLSVWPIFNWNFSLK